MDKTSIGLKLLMRSSLWWIHAGKPFKGRKLTKVTSGKSSKLERASHFFLPIAI